MASDIEIDAMRRALEIARERGNVLPESDRRMCAARARWPRDRPRRHDPARRARRGGRATAGRRRGARCHRGGHAGALQPHRPHRAVLAGADPSRHRARRVLAVRSPCRSGRGSGHPSRGRDLGRSRHPGRRDGGAQRGLDLRRHPRPSVRHLEVRRHARWPQCGPRRHQPVDHGRGGPPRRAEAPRRHRRDHGRHRHRAGGRPAAHDPRRARPALAARGAAVARRGGRLADPHGRPRPRRRGPIGRHRVARPGRRAGRAGSSATSDTSGSRAARASPAPSGTQD